jgi:predicted PurR-regulated permease PerM
LLKLEISYRGLTFIILSLVAIWAFIELWPVLLLVLISLILMLGVLPYVEAMADRGVPRSVTVLIFLVATLAVIAGLFSLVVPAMIEEFDNVHDNLPETAREVEEFLASLGINVELQQRAREFDWNQLISGRAAVDYGQRVLTVTVSVITVMAMTAYLLADTPRLTRFVGQFIPNEKKDDANLLFLSMSRMVGGYLRGQLVLSLTISLFTFVFLQIIGVPNALAFAVFAGVVDVVPLVGALIATIAPAGAALQQSPVHTLAVVIGFVLYQQFEDRVLAPRIYGQTLNLPPIIVLIAVLAGAELLGITGVILALPLTAAGRVLVDYAIETRQIRLAAQAEDQPLAPDSLEAEDKNPGRRRRARPRTQTPRPSPTGRRNRS